MSSPSDAPPAAPEAAAAPARRRRHVARWVLLAVVAVLMVAGGTVAWMWFHTGAHELSTSVAIQRFRSGGGGAGTDSGGPAAGIYLYRGSGTESVSLPPKSQTEGPTIPATVTSRPGGCFEFRLDYSDHHWQNWIYCAKDGGMVTTSRAGYYKWDFVAFTIDDTSTYVCAPPAVTVPAELTAGARHPLSCTGANDKLSTGPVHMDGTSTVVGTTRLRVGGNVVDAVHVRESAAFSGGQTGTNVADTWFSVATGLPLRGTWHTTVSTPSPVGDSTLHAGGDFTLTSLTPRR